MNYEEGFLQAIGLPTFTIILLYLQKPLKTLNHGGKKVSIIVLILLLWMTSLCIRMSGLQVHHSTQFPSLQY